MNPSCVITIIDSTKFSSTDGSIVLSLVSPDLQGMLVLNVYLYGEQLNDPLLQGNRKRMRANFLPLPYGCMVQVQCE